MKRKTLRQTFRETQVDSSKETNPNQASLLRSH
jgi:hypothetical protein